MPRQNKFSFFFLIVCLSFGLVAAAETKGRSPIAKVRAAIERIKPFSVLFVQQVFDEDQLEIEESGEIIFKDPKTLKWTYLEPERKIFLLKGDEYRFYDEENLQLTVGKVKDKRGQWIWQLLFSDEIDRYVKVDARLRKITIKNEKDGLDVEIFLNSRYLPEKALQDDPSGARLVYLFREYKEKVKITPGTFELEVPGEVDVVIE